ncbi:MAG3960 family lipoprotein [Mycoplasmopsis agalactiae]|uniref:MAG3960 family lipoprotein n=1 Tax=Mycoplasmopsis agalactiae TaxID=2110 RepID=UPI002F402AE7
MKKKLFLSPLSSIVGFPLLMISCWNNQSKKDDSTTETLVIINPGTGEKMPDKKPNNKESNETNNQNNAPTEFTYNGKAYTINREDTLDTKDAIYANLVLNSNAEGFKKLIPDAEEYRKVKNLYADDNGFPSIAEVSYYVRNLEHFKNGFIYREKSNSPERISKDEYISLVDKVYEIMADSKLNIALNDTNKKYVDFDNVRNYTLARLAEFHGKDSKEWGELKTEKVPDLEPGSFKIEEYYKEIPPENDYYELRTHELKQRPSKLWIYNRMINNSDFYNYEANKPNELFLNNEFLYGKKLDPEKYFLEIDILMLIIWLKAKRYTMQYPLWRMLITYLEFQKALIQKQEWDKEKSLKDNFEKLGIIDKLNNFHNAIFEYMKLGQLVGFTDESNNLYLFPTDLNKEVKTDFRDAYRWAYYEYHLFIQPIYTALNKNISIVFENAFENANVKPYYDFIWENIRVADKVDKPRILSKEEALEKAKEIIKHYQNNFGWEFKI